LQGVYAVREPNGVSRLYGHVIAEV